MHDAVSAAMPQHSGSPAAGRRGPCWGARTAYLLWYGPVTAVNSLLLDRASAHTLLSAEAALLNLLLTAALRGGRLATAARRCAGGLPEPPSGQHGPAPAAALPHCPRCLKRCRAHTGNRSRSPCRARTARKAARSPRPPA